MPERITTLAASVLLFATFAAGPGRGVLQHESDTPRETPTVEREAKIAAPATDSIVTATMLLEDFFGAPLERVPACTTSDQCYDLDFVIVTLPDPLDSFLDWAFDADLESMRRAFETAQYVTNRFWLPWDEDRRTGGAGRATQYRHGAPGVFLLRNSNPERHRLRIVYVVGEISTGGVHKRALEAALDERRRLLDRHRFADSTGARDTIRFVGPFFTGSALSIRTTIEQWRRRTRDSSFALLVSGAATGAGNLVVFDSSHDAPQPAARMSFRATVNADLTLSLAMLRVLVDTGTGLGIPADHIALIQESSTQYGQQAAARSPPNDSVPRDSAKAVELAVRSRVSRSPVAKTLAPLMAEVAKATNEMLIVPYPMSISSLRAEYAKRPLPATTSDGGPKHTEPRIPLALFDASHQLETPTSLAQLTPAALELMIDEIAHALKAHDIRAIGLIGTDVRDRIFMADQLRKRLPDARLFTFGSNNLYLREDYNNSLRGMLVFSTYPLLMENQWWDVVNGARPRRLAFSSDDAQGVFNATLRQLGRQRLREYRPPFDSVGGRPPVWVTAVGRHSFVPVRVLASLGGADQYLEQPPLPPRLKLDPERHVPHSAWVRWLMYVAIAGSVLFLVLRDDDRSRQRVPIHVDAASTSGATATTNVATTAERSTAELAVRRFAERRRLGQRAALLVHREIYTFLRHLAVLCVVAALSVIVVPQAAEFPSLGWATPAVYVLLALAAATAFVVFVIRLRAVWLESGAAYRDYVYRPSHKWMQREVARIRRRASRDRHPVLQTLAMLTSTHEYEIRARAPREELRVWRREGIVIAITAVVGIAYATAVAMLIVDLRWLTPSDALLFVHRATQLDSGISPVFPIVVSGVALAIVCTWQLARVALLNEVTPFEEAFQQSPTKAAETEGDEIRSRLARGLHGARIHLSRVIPELPAGIGKPLFGLLLLVLGSALWMHFEPSFEAVTDLPRVGGATAFDIVFRLSILMIFAAAVWALARLIMVWGALSVTLRALDASPLITAFERLPRRIARLTRLTLFADPSRETVRAVTATQWMHLRTLFVANEAEFEKLSTSAWADVRRLMEEDAPVQGRDHRRAGVGFAPQLKEMLALIERFWASEPALAQVDAVIADLKGAPAAREGESTSGRIRRSFPDAVRLWVRSAEEFVAVQAVDYIAWVLRHLRRLVLMLLFLLVVTMSLLSSYSFLPQSAVRSLFLLLFIAVVVSLLLLLLQMNRNEVLSRVTRTDPGRVNWNAHFVINIAMVVAVPMLSLVSAMSPLRTDLFGWIDVLLRALNKQ